VAKAHPCFSFRGGALLLNGVGTRAEATIKKIWAMTCLGRGFPSLGLERAALVGRRVGEATCRLLWSGRYLEIGFDVAMRLARAAPPSNYRTTVGSSPHVFALPSRGQCPSSKKNGLSIPEA